MPNARKTEILRIVREILPEFIDSNPPERKQPRCTNIAISIEGTRSVMDAIHALQTMNAANLSQFGG